MLAKFEDEKIGTKAAEGVSQQASQQPLQDLIQKTNPKMASEPAYRMGWHESRLAHQQVMQKQQEQIVQELTSAKKIYRDVFRLASEVRLQSEQCQEQLKQCELAPTQEMDQRIAAALAHLERQITDMQALQQQFSDGSSLQQQEVARKLDQGIDKLRSEANQFRLEFAQLSQSFSVVKDTGMQLQLHVQELSRFQQKSGDQVNNLQRDQADLQNRCASLSLEQMRQNQDIKTTVLKLGELEQRVLQTSEHWQHLEKESRLLLQRMESQLVEHQRMLFRNESLQEQTENALDTMEGFKFELQQEWQQQSQRMSTQESMLSQLLLEGQRHQEVMHSGVERMNRLQDRQEEVQTQWMGLSEQMVATHQSMETLQARAHLSLSRAEELLHTAQQDREEVQQLAADVRQVHEEYTADAEQVKSSMSQFQGRISQLDQQLGQGQGLAIQLLDLGHKLEASAQSEREANTLLIQQMLQNQQLQKSGEELLQQTQRFFQREQLLTEQIQQAQEHTVILQQRLDAQERLLNQAGEREEEWRRMLQEQTEERLRQAKIVEEQEEKLQHWHKLAQQALRRLKEMELSQREAQINQKEHQWLMTQTRQEQSQLHRERQNMQSQVQDLEARIHEMALAMNESKPRSDWKPAIEQIQAQLLEFKVDVARLRQTTSQWEEQKNTAVNAVEMTKDATMRGNKRWWG